MEKKLFVNTIIAAYNAQAVNPELMFVKQFKTEMLHRKRLFITLLTMLTPMNPRSLLKTNHLSSI